MDCVDERIDDRIDNGIDSRIADCKVRVEFRNRDMEIVSEKVYTFHDHIEILKTGLIRLIPDIEDLAYRATDGKSKEEWPEDVIASFSRLRHKVLDMAGEVARLPSNMILGDGQRAKGGFYSPPVRPMRLTRAQDEDTPPAPRGFLSGLKREK